MVEYRSRTTGQALTFPFLNPSGRNQFTSRPGGSLIHVSMDVEALRHMVNGIQGDLGRADPAIYAAMQQISMELMESQQRVLIDRIGMTGRDQRGTKYLVDALVNEKNRKVNIDGFTVGYLDEAWSHVKSYYRGLEEGTRVHLTDVSGMTLRGLWITSGGLQQPVLGANNAIGFRGRYVDAANTGGKRKDGLPGRVLGGQVFGGGFRITRPIPAYEYQSQGTREWLTAGSGNPNNAIGVLEAQFGKANLNWLQRFVRATGHEPSAADASVNIAGIAPLGR